MKVLFATVGSRGDVQPLCILAAALQRRGHDVIMAAPPDARDFVAGFGVPFVPCGVDVGRWLAEVEPSALSMGRALKEFQAYIQADVARQAPVLLDAATDCDLVVSAGLMALGATVADAHGAASAYLYYAPVLLPSSHHPPIFAPWQGLPRLVNRALHAFNAGFFSKVILPVVNAERQKLGLSLHPNFVTALPPDLLLAWDQELAPSPPDLEESAARHGMKQTLHAVGAIQPASAPLGDEVLAFLDAGPCVYVGFGSMPDKAPERTLALVCEAAGRAGVRAVVLGGERARVGDVLVVDSISHGALFPRMRAIVHHCGSGTTAAASRAGVPQVAVPHFVDQPFWAHRLQRAGVSAATLSRGRLTALRLADALRRCVDDETLNASARALAGRLSSADPVAEAVRVLEQLATRPRAPAHPRTPSPGDRQGPSTG